MEKRISLQNVGIQFKNKVIFHNFSFSMEYGQDVCLIGSEGVGKTLLLKAILGLVSFSGEIVKEVPCRGILTLNEKFSGTIFEYLNYSSLSESDQMLVTRFLKLKTFHYSVSRLNSFFRLKVLLLKQVLFHPKFLMFDDVLSFLSMNERQEIFDFLHQEGITVFYVTSDIEDILFFPYCVVMGREGVLMEGKTNLVLQEEKILRRLGFSLPFYVDLSLQLERYGLIDQIYTNGKELADCLWKSN